jgi:hypothetical protein
MCSKTLLVVQVQVQHTLYFVYPHDNTTQIKIRIQYRKIIDSIHCWKENLRLKLPRRVATWENGRLRSTVSWDDIYVGAAKLKKSLFRALMENKHTLPAVVCAIEDDVLSAMLSYKGCLYDTGILFTFEVHSGLSSEAFHPRIQRIIPGYFGGFRPDASIQYSCCRSSNIIQQIQSLQITLALPSFQLIISLGFKLT